jgi:signal peptidase I
MTIVPAYLWLTSGMMNIGVTSIRGNSMLPTFADGQMLYVQPAQCERGEIIVAKCNNTGDYNVNGIALLKRIVGLPGETLEITKDGILIDGKLLDETSYIDCQDKSLQENNNIEEIILSDCEYFIVGDNRADSFDSRHIGAVHSKDFLYGLTTEPNDYTRTILKNVVIVALINLFLLIMLPKGVLIALTLNRKTKEEREAIKKDRLIKRQNRITARKNKKNQKYSSTTNIPKRAKKYVKRKRK